MAATAPTANENALLFVCTGNYYRSRFAEEYFNHYARAMRLAWTSYSKGFARDMSKTGNVGPISSHTLAGLAERGIEPRGARRFPESLREEDFRSYDRIILLSHTEHAPMLGRYFPHVETAVSFFDIEDIHIETPASALARLSRALDDLISGLRVQMGAGAGR